MDSNVSKYSANEKVTVMSQAEHTKPATKSNKSLSIVALTSGVVLALLFIFLFMWKPVGISYLIFSIALVIGSLAPAFTAKKNNLPDGFYKRFAIYSTVMVILSAVFILRLSTIPQAWAFLLIPFVYGLLVLWTYNPSVVKNFGAMYLLQLPFLVIGQTLSKMFKYLKDHRPKVFASAKMGSVTRRALIGFLISIPFLLIFYGLFASSNPEFAHDFNQLLTNFIKIFFEDWKTFWQFFDKLFWGYWIGLYLTSWHYFSWFSESDLASKFESLTDFNESKYKKNLDYVIVTVFLFFINFLFLSYVILQHKYFFNADYNILSDNAKYNYADYARQGFGELVMTSVIVYIILLIVNLKTELTSLMSKVLFRINSNLLGALTLVIAFSSIYRIAKLQSVYGYTDIRAYGIFGTAVVAILILGIMILAWLPKYVTRASRMVSVMALLTVLIYLFFPLDLYLARGNYQRFKDTGDIDVPYMVNLSDDALPVMLELYDDEDFSELSRAILVRNLSDRYNVYKKDFSDWTAYSPLRNSYYKQIRDILDVADTDVESTLKSFINDYAAELESENFETAFDEYWSQTQKQNDFTPLDEIDITEVDVTDIPEYKDWDAINYRTKVNSYISYDSKEYWNGMEVTLRMYYTNTTTGELYCLTDRVHVKLEGNKWAIVSAEKFSLGSNSHNLYNRLEDIFRSSNICYDYSY